MEGYTQVSSSNCKVNTKEIYCMIRHTIVPNSGEFTDNQKMLIASNWQTSMKCLPLLQLYFDITDDVLASLID